MKKSANIFEKKVYEIFSGIEEYTEDAKAKTVTLVIGSSGFNAEDLFALSDLLGTGFIRFYPETRSEGYCETCSYEYGVVVMEATKVKF